MRCVLWSSKLDVAALLMAEKFTSYKQYSRGITATATNGHKLPDKDDNHTGMKLVVALLVVPENVWLQTTHLRRHMLQSVLTPNLHLRPSNPLPSTSVLTHPLDVGAAATQPMTHDQIQRAQAEALKVFEQAHAEVIANGDNEYSNQELLDFDEDHSDDPIDEWSPN